MKKTKEVYISSKDEKYEEILSVVDEFIATLDFDKKKAIRMRLLAEETIGMVHAMTGDFKALFWLEYEDGEYRVRLSAKVQMDRQKKDGLLSVSTSGKNASVKGFMSKVADVIENGVLNYSELMKIDLQNGGYIDYTLMGYGIPGAMPVAHAPIVWSLSTYKKGLGEANVEEEPVKEAWDELEKSIVASIASDVIVGIKKDNVDMTILAK